MTIRLLIADSQEISRRGLRSFLAHTEIKVVSETGTCNEAIYLATSLKLDLLLMSIRLPHENGFLAMVRIIRKRRRLPVVMLGEGYDPRHLARAYELGAAAFLPRSVNRETLQATLRGAVNGEEFWTREQIRRISTVPPTRPMKADADAILTPRERDIIRMIIQGFSNPAMAEKLDISHETVKVHLHNILQRLWVTDRTQIALWAVRNGLD